MLTKDCEWTVDVLNRVTVMEPPNSWTPCGLILYCQQQKAGSGENSYHADRLVEAPLSPETSGRSDLCTSSTFEATQTDHMQSNYIYIESYVVPLEQVIQQFSSRDDLIEVLLASCCVYV